MYNGDHRVRAGGRGGGGKRVFWRGWGVGGLRFVFGSRATTRDHSGFKKSYNEHYVKWPMCQPLPYHGITQA